jgi:putative membrane protein
MGCAEVVPGVSGGTIALIVGIYERLLISLRAAVTVAVETVRRDRDARRAAFAEIDWRLLVPLFAGMGVAVLLGARIIPPLLDEFPEESSALFFGLIVASLAVPWAMWRHKRPQHVAGLVVMALAAFVLTGLGEREVSDPSMIVVFGAAAVAICALTLPGVSGSYLLLAMGLYAPTLDAVDGRDLGYLAVFGAGALLGLALFARVLTRLLREHRDATVAALLGLMVGSLRALWPWADEQETLQAPPGELSEVLPVAGFAVLGMAIVIGLLLASRGDGDTLAPDPEPALVGRDRDRAGDADDDDAPREPAGTAGGTR